MCKYVDLILRAGSSGYILLDSIFYRNSAFGFSSFIDMPFIVYSFLETISFSCKKPVQNPAGFKVFLSWWFLTHFIDVNDMGDR